MNLNLSHEPTFSEKSRHAALNIPSDALRRPRTPHFAPPCLKPARALASTASSFTQVMAQHLNTLAQREIDDKRAGYHQFMDEYLRARPEIHPGPALRFERLAQVENSSILIYFRDKNDQLQTPVKIRQEHPDFEHLQDLHTAMSAQGPWYLLSEDTLQALVRMPAPPASPRILAACLHIRRLQDASIRLLTDSNPGPGRWMPTLDIGQIPGMKSQYLIKLIDLDQPGRSKLRATHETAFIEFKTYVDQQIEALRQSGIARGETLSRTSHVQAELLGHLMLDMLNIMIPRLFLACPLATDGDFATIILEYIRRSANPKAPAPTPPQD